MGLAGGNTILQVGSWLEDEKPSIAGSRLFSRRFCLDGAAMCERWGGWLAGLIWIMAQGQAALIHRQGKWSRSGSQLLTVTLASSSSPASCANLITLSGQIRRLRCQRLCLLSVLRSFRLPQPCVQMWVCVHRLQLCLCITLQVWDSWVTDDTHWSFKSTQILLSRAQTSAIDGCD